MKLFITLLAILFIVVGLSLGVYAAKLYGQLAFLTYAHYVSLFLLLMAYILSWVAMTWMASPNKFNVRPKQWIAFGFTLLMAFFWWGRYVFTISDIGSTGHGGAVDDVQNK